MTAILASCSESLPSVAEIVGLVERDELDRQGTGLEHEREILAPR